MTQVPGPDIATEHADAEEEGTTSVRSRHSSLDGPYRQAQAENTFARCNMVTSVAGSEETYSRSLLFSGHGFSFWNIYGNSSRPKKHIEQGVSIGDVGMVDPGGDFVYGFNIFAAPTDPVQPNKLPEEFEEVNPPLDRDTEIQFVPEYFARGTVITSKGVHIRRISEDPLEISFSTTAREGALVVLPEGGSREDLKSTSRLTEHINKNAVKWYNHIFNHGLSEAITFPNASLYLITGCDKAKSWSAVSIPREPADSGKKIEMTYRVGDSSPWNDDALARAKSFNPEEEKDKNFCVFVRGIRISLSNRLWLRHLPCRPPDRAAYYNLLSSPIVGFPSKLVRLKERLFGVTRPWLSERQQVPFHPAMIISQILLDKHPTADVAIVEDSTWCNLAPGSEGTAPRILDVIARAIASCDIVLDDKLVMLVPKSSNSTEAKPKVGFVRYVMARHTESQARKKALQLAKRITQLR
ncbi:hypothetical protein GALMADRAFT_160575 [Galerina marginata CBS 339.88]|uniref:Uncharacterized protein n=1 Tax=Galerina marginata (strain CBS 339.88) TaxID=685588 RepID=A0A067SGZ8_GALM3|nr:hypothetical protein GALMADRAFT_160575 [Galerina marginata CBS 339.88]